MGDMELIFPDGVKVTIDQDERVTFTLVDFRDCCELCNDPRMVHEGELVKCAGCGCINHIDYGRKA
jgi:hypothetical protein